jgi:hypothetical protein
VIVEPIQPKAMPVILTTDEERDVWIVRLGTRRRPCSGHCPTTLCGSWRVAPIRKTVRRREKAVRQVRLRSRHGFKSNAIVGAAAFADQALVTAPRGRRGHATSILRARVDLAHRGRNEKPDLYAVATCAKVRPYLTSSRYPTAAKDISDPLERFRPVSLYDYFFFFEVFFATFLVAAFAVFFAFFAFLAMWSSVKNWLSEHEHAVDRHAQH